MDDYDDDPFDEHQLLNAICALKNIPVPDSSGRKTLNQQANAAPKTFIALNPLIILNPPANYIAMKEDDPRYKFPAMMNEAYCSGDVESYRDVMRRICEPDMEYVMQYDGKQNPYGPNERHIKGLENSVDFFLACLYSAPDIVPSMYETPRGFWDADTDEAFLKFKVLVSMTKISVVMDPEQVKASSSSGAIDPQGDVLKSVNDYNLVRLPTALPVITSYQCCKYSCFINANHRITKICMLFKQMMYDPKMKHIKSITSSSNNNSNNNLNSNNVNNNNSSSSGSGKRTVTNKHNNNKLNKNNKRRKVVSSASFEEEVRKIQQQKQLISHNNNNVNIQSSSSINNNNNSNNNNASTTTSSTGVSSERKEEKVDSDEQR